MGGYRVPNQGPNDDSYDEEGYDESQRAEIVEATGDAPSDGVILTDIPIDIEDPDEDLDSLEELDMIDSDKGEVADLDSPAEDIEEDELQNDYDAETLSEDAEDRDDADNAALEP